MTSRPHSSSRGMNASPTSESGGREGFKPCSKCKKKKTITEFYVDSANKDGGRHACRVCESSGANKYIGIHHKCIDKFLYGRVINPYVMYELEKKSWESSNPDADHRQHSKAMKAIANRLGI